MSPLTESGILLIKVIFSLVISLVMLRFILQLVRADFYNPFSQFIVRFTTPILRPFRRVIPGYRGIDTSSLVVMLLLQAAELWLISLVAGMSVSLYILSVLSLTELITLVLNIFMITIIAQIVISWLQVMNGNGYAALQNPLYSLLIQINEPLMRPARRLLPPVSGIDLSPMLVIVAIQLAKILLVGSIRTLALG